MRNIYVSVTNDLVSDARAHRTCLSLLKSLSVVTLIGRKLNGSMDINNRTYLTKRFRMKFNKGFLFYLFYNIRLFLFLVTRKRNSLLVACDLDTLPANFLASGLRNFKLVYDSHEYFTEVPELQNRLFVKKVWTIIEKLIVPSLKWAYTVSEPIAREYTGKYGVNFEVIRNLPMRKEKGSKYPLPEDFLTKKKIIYQGAVNIGRGIEQVMDAIMLMDNVVFIIAGDGDILQTLKAKAESEKLKGKVYFTGRLPLEQLHELTVLGDLGVSLEQNLGKSYQYALPNKLFDYFQAGIPVMVSDLPAMRDIVENFDTGIVVMDTKPLYLKEKLEFMLYNKDHIEKWKANTLIAAEELSWEKEEKKLIEIYRRAGLGFI